MIVNPKPGFLCKSDSYKKTVFMKIKTKAGGTLCLVK